MDSVHTSIKDKCEGSIKSQITGMSYEFVSLKGTSIISVTACNVPSAPELKLTPYIIALAPTLRNHKS